LRFGNANSAQFTFSTLLHHPCHLSSVRPHSRMFPRYCYCRIESVTCAKLPGKPFHSDVICDIVGMQVLGCAAKGGSSSLASSHMVYNELAATRPDLIHTLASSNWVFDT
jgi:hypothetical protein